MAKLNKRLHYKKDGKVDSISIYTTLDEVGEAGVPVKVDGIDGYFMYAEAGREYSTRMNCKVGSEIYKAQKEGLYPSMIVLMARDVETEELISSVAYIAPEDGELYLNNENAPVIEGYDFVVMDGIVKSGVVENDVIDVWYVSNTVPNRTKTSWSSYYNGDTTLTAGPLINTYSAKNMDSMFKGCTALTSIKRMNTSNVTNTASLFYNCRAIKVIPDMDLNKTTSLYQFCRNCYVLKNLPYIGIPRPTTIYEAFRECRVLESHIYLDLTKCTAGHAAFYDCYKVKEITLVNPSSLSMISYMFYNCEELSKLNIIDGRLRPSDIGSMFYDCVKLKQDIEIDMSRCHTWNNAFTGCSAKAVLYNVPKENDLSTIGTTNYVVVNYVPNYSTITVEVDTKYPDATIDLPAQADIGTVITISKVQGDYKVKSLVCNVANALVDNGDSYILTVPVQDIILTPVYGHTPTITVIADTNYPDVTLMVPEEAEAGTIITISMVASDYDLSALGCNIPSALVFDGTNWILTMPDDDIVLEPKYYEKVYILGTTDEGLAHEHHRPYGFMDDYSFDIPYNTLPTDYSVALETCQATYDAQAASEEVLWSMDEYPGTWSEDPYDMVYDGIVREPNRLVLYHYGTDDTLKGFIETIPESTTDVITLSVQLYYLSPSHEIKQQQVSQWQFREHNFEQEDVFPPVAPYEYRGYGAIEINGNTMKFTRSLFPIDGMESIGEIYPYEVTATLPSGRKIIKYVCGYYSYECLAADTLITLADGSVKMFGDLTIDDTVRVWDFDNGCYAEAKLLWLPKVKIANRYMIITTNTGRTIKQINNHRFLSVNKGKFEQSTELLGDVIWTEDGFETVVSTEWVEEPIAYRNAISYYHMNLITNGMLSSCRFNNVYPIKDMKFVKEEREVRPISEFEVSESFYKGMRLSEQLLPTEEINAYVGRLMRNGESNEKVSF